MAFHLASGACNYMLDQLRTVKITHAALFDGAAEVAARQAIAFDAAAGREIVATTSVAFTVASGSKVNKVALYDDATTGTMLAEVTVLEQSFAATGTYILETTKVNLKLEV